MFKLYLMYVLVGGQFQAVVSDDTYKTLEECHAAEITVSEAVAAEESVAGFATACINSAEQLAI